MHDCLHIRNISRIKSPRMRQLAKGIAAGSETDVQRFCDLETTFETSDAILFLPALFLNLDIARIPTPSRIDTLLSDRLPIPYIRLAFDSLRAICHLASMDGIPIDASPDLWPSLWNWLDFFHTYWDHLPFAKRVSRIQSCMLHSSILLALDKDEDTSKVLRSTPGVRRILAAAWKGMLYDDAMFSRSPSGAFSIIIDIFRPLLIGATEKQAGFEEIVEAVGGLEDLASALLQHLARARVNPNVHETGKFVFSCFGFFMSDFQEAFHPLQAVLHSMGFIPIVVTTLSSLHGTAADSGVEMCLSYLANHLSSPSEIALALESGLLPVILGIAGSTESPTNGIRRLITKMLDEVLPRSLVHHTVLSLLQKSLPEAIVLARDSTIHTSTFSANWIGLVSMMKARLDFFNSWEAQSRPCYKACDNLACGKIDVRRSFKCCSTCHGADYCSEECQSADWRAGHRDMCQRLAAIRLQKPETLTTRGRCFLRALLSHDYRRLMPNICVQQILFMYEHPGEQFWTMFTYTSGNEVLVDIKPRGKLEGRDWASKVLSQFPRVARSGGRMDLHLMFVFDGRVIRVLMFPMRSATTRLHDGLVRVAQQIPPGTTTAEAVPLIQRLVDRLISKVESEEIFIH
ncbi:hypothetical protein C8R45DRAFT_1220744 [Mycena sanguinolenta]|nr:hypothetical protein C8R45DRAFT_1220744 [Mycena sanguinolenta]